MGSAVADILGTSSVIINDLKLKRSATYEFDLETASKVRLGSISFPSNFKILAVFVKGDRLHGIQTAVHSLSAVQIGRHSRR